MNNTFVNGGTGNRWIEDERVRQYNEKGLEIIFIRDCP